MGLCRRRERISYRRFPVDFESDSLCAQHHQPSRHIHSPTRVESLLPGSRELGGTSASLRRKICMDNHRRRTTNASLPPAKNRSRRYFHLDYRRTTNHSLHHQPGFTGRIYLRHTVAIPLAGHISPDDMGKREKPKFEIRDKIDIVATSKGPASYSFCFKR